MTSPQSGQPHESAAAQPNQRLGQQPGYQAGPPFPQNQSQSQGQSFPGYQPQHPSQQHYPQGQLPYQQPLGQAPGHGQFGVPASSWAPQRKPGPLTLPGWGAVPAVLGVLLTLGGILLAPWATDHSFFDLIALAKGSSSFAAYYVKFLGFIAAAAGALAILPWTFGALRTSRSAYLLSGIRRKELTKRNFWWYQTVFSGRATTMLVIHLVGIYFVYKGNFELFTAGPILVIGGGLLLIAGAAIGPRKGPSLPQ